MEPSHLPFMAGLGHDVSGRDAQETLGLPTTKRQHETQRCGRRHSACADAIDHVSRKRIERIQPEL